MKGRSIGIALVIFATTAFVFLTTSTYGGYPGYPGPDEREEPENTPYFCDSCGAISRTYGEYYGDTAGYHWVHHLSSRWADSGYQFDGAMGIHWYGSSYDANLGWCWEYADELQYGRDITTGFWVGNPPVYYEGVAPATYMVTITYSSFINLNDYTTDEVTNIVVMPIDV